MILSDPIFDAVFKNFSAKFPDYHYDTTGSAISVMDSTVIIARIFLLIDDSKTLRSIRLLAFSAAVLSRVKPYFNERLKADILYGFRRESRDQEEILQLALMTRLTTFESEQYGLDEDQ